MRTGIERNLRQGTLEPTIDCLRDSEFETEFLSVLKDRFAWTSAEGVAELEGPTLARCTWNRIALGDKWAD